MNDWDALSCQPHCRDPTSPRESPFRRWSAHPAHSSYTRCQCSWCHLGTAAIGYCESLGWVRVVSLTDKLFSNSRRTTQTRFCGDGLRQYSGKYWHGPGNPSCYRGRFLCGGILSIERTQWAGRMLVRVQWSLCRMCRVATSRVRCRRWTGWNWRLLSRSGCYTKTMLLLLSRVVCRTLSLRVRWTIIASFAL